jgi:ADP-ribose pyrophosphatase YjhB (NUDIX family)
VTTPTRLAWARSLQAIAQSGLAWEPSAFDRERYEHVRRVAAEMLAHPNGGDADRVDEIMAAEYGHATPKLDTRAAVFREDGILLVKEALDGAWNLPGGWADVGESPSDAVTREALEESGYRTRAVRLLGLYDRDRHGYPAHQWHIWKAIFLCELVDSEQQPLGAETLEAGFFARDRLPPLRFAHSSERTIDRCFELRDHDGPAEFD